MSGSGIFSAEAPRLYSIDPGRPFLIDLASVIRELAARDPLALSDALVFVPTRRAVRALTEAFIHVARARATILPRIKALGDVDEDELALAPPELADAIELPPAVSTMERRLVLARFVAAADKTFAGQENWPAALAAAKELGALFDSFYAEEVDFSRLEGLAPSEHAAHWACSLKFLQIVTRAWPDYLASTGRIDPAERRAKLIDLQAKRFQAAPPKHPVIVAGTTGSAPAVARLMRVVAGLKRGAVVLPGLDRALAGEAKAWRAIDDPHPQSGLKALLAALGAEPRDVKPWPGAESASERAALVSLALRPAEATDDWRELVLAASRDDPQLRRASTGLSLIEAADEEKEADACAILLREALEKPGRTAMLVTPDRTLGRRVAAKMRRWGVIVDDSAGIPFSNTPCGTYLRLVAEWIADPIDGVALLSLARHPLSGFGLEAKARFTSVGAVDKGLRGLAPGPDFEALARRLALDEHRANLSRPVIDALRDAAAIWPKSGAAPFNELLAAHINAAELLASDAEESGATRLWRAEDGEIGSLLIAEIRAMAGTLGTFAAGDYAQAFAHLCAGASVRRKIPAHPRLAILGPLEARLQSADLIVLGGLNEGVWPGDAMIDPFLSRQMRGDIDLPSPERRQGLAAHDFAQLASAPNVALTRARMAGGAPSKPSRWIVRLKNILTGASALPAVDQTARLADWIGALDVAERVQPITAPRPKPPVSARPRKLAVTRFEHLIRDPYSVYARHILGLRKLDRIAEPLAQKHLGSLLHKVFENYSRSGVDPRSAEARAALGRMFDEAAAEAGIAGANLVLWRPKLDAALDWFAGWDGERRAQASLAIVEDEIAAEFQIGAATFTLTARADRIDLTETGAALIDYKSGFLPTLDQMKTGFSPQLPLTGMIVEAGGLGEERRVASFHYVKILNHKGDHRDFSGEESQGARALIEEARKGFESLVAAFDDPETAYSSQPRPQFVNRFGDYDHLARRREWASEGESE